jgi:hypothetical protein
MKVIQGEAVFTRLTGMGDGQLARYKHRVLGGFQRLY